MVNRHVLASLVALSILASAAPSPAQEPPDLTYGSVVRLQSKVLNEERRINVFLPPAYEKSSNRFPVLYLLDGSAHEDYFHVTSLIDFLATYDAMPATIVIGISNVDRRRDFTPPSEDEKDRAAAPTSGGADKFVSFLETELIPYVDSHYRTNGTRTIIGQSLGGLLATKVLLEKPRLFDQYVIVSPSLWWNRETLLGGAATLLKKSPTANRKIYLSVGDEHPQMKEEARRLADLIPKSGWANLQFYYDYLVAEDHATSLHISVYNAMKDFYPRPKPK
jgi:predicted alpha/beta superfamily hydrolase